ncbi:hypothetical protein LARV_00942 [Longilinea arvoryzae]|uniref:Uncharacterized protein n=2 Tax=Longilinea arvoryzae TaxID=360412 RepID=A0A0S7B7K0_9CHLR|nr:hypothetical protein LARV_00942 [Longilinea arvoryzae]
MKIVAVVFSLIRKVISVAMILAICVPLLFVAYKGSQPMQVSQTPSGMTYWQFIADRIDAAKEVKPSRCGWGMFLSLVALGPLYSVVYTDIGIHPDGFLASVTAPDSDIPKGVENASWDQVPRIWWNVVEQLSWTMLGKANPGCRFRPVANLWYRT